MPEARRRELTCIFCWQESPNLAALRAHSAACPEHPAVKRAVAAEAEAGRLRDLVAGMTAALSIDTLDADPVAACRALAEDLARLRAEAGEDELLPEMTDGRLPCPECGRLSSVVEWYDKGPGAEVWECDSCRHRWQAGAPPAEGGAS